MSGSRVLGQGTLKMQRSLRVAAVPSLDYPTIGVRCKEGICEFGPKFSTVAPLLIASKETCLIKKTRVAKGRFRGLSKPRQVLGMFTFYLNPSDNELHKVMFRGNLSLSLQNEACNLRQDPHPIKHHLP